MAMMVNVG